MHLTLHIQACCVISPIMEVDKRVLSYHNPTYIIEENCNFRKQEAGDMGRMERGQEE